MVPWGEKEASGSIGLAAVGDAIGDGLAACELAIMDPDTLLGGILCAFMVVNRKKLGVRPLGWVQERHERRKIGKWTGYK